MKKAFLFLLFVLVFGAYNPAFASRHEAKAPSIPCPGNLPCIQEETQKKGGEEVRKYVTETFAVKFLRTFLGIAAITAVIFIIVGGIQMHLAFGNEEALGKAKKTLLWAVIGLVIAILSVAIVKIVSTIL